LSDCLVKMGKTCRNLGFAGMRKNRTVLLLLIALGPICRGDTFVHRRTGQVLHGYASSYRADANMVVQTREKGVLELKAAQWDITADRTGRNNKVIVLTIDGNILLRIQTEALVKALAEATAKGPLFILLDVDTPGGRVDYTRRICAAISRTAPCQVIAFVRGGPYGGAISAGAALAFACDKIYMGQGAAIGAASTVGLTRAGVKDFKEIYGEELAEKINSAWRTYLASLAEQKNRPPLLACAMVDENIEVVEVRQANRSLFIEPVNKKPEQHIIHTWSTKGSLLTLTAEETVRCGIAEKVVKSRAEVLQDLGAADAEIVIDNAFIEARQRYERAAARFNKLSKSLDLKIKQLRQAPNEIRAARLLRDIRNGYKSLLSLARLYPDLHIDGGFLQQQLNSAEALYQETRMRRQTPR